MRKESFMEVKTQEQIKTDPFKKVGEGNKGMYTVIAIAAINLLISIFYTVWDAIDGYSLSSDVISIIICIVVGLFILAGMSWMRYLFACYCGYSAFCKILNLIFFIGEIHTQSLDWFYIILNAVLLIYYLASMLMLLINRNVKAYFAPDSE